MEIPQFCNIGNFSFTEDEIKANSLSSYIQDKIGLDNFRVLELQGDERTIYCLERLSQQINIDGFENFFDYTIAILYNEIMDALRVIDATPMADLLSKSKQIVMGDTEPTRQVLENIDSGDHQEELRAIEDRAAEADFHKRLKDFVLMCFEQHGFVVAKQPETPAAERKSPTPAPPRTTPPPASIATFKIGDIIEQYRHFGNTSFIAGPNENKAGTKWKVISINNYDMELELVEGIFRLPSTGDRSPGFVTRFFSSEVYRKAFPKNGYNQQTFDEFRRCDENAA